MEREEIQERFLRFIDEFYKAELSEACLEGKESLEIDFSKLDRFDVELADLLLEKPEEMLEIFENALKEIEVDLPERFRIRVFNLPESRQIRIRDLRAEHIGKLISVEGIVIRASEVRPEIEKAVFSCLNCGAQITVVQTERTIKEPKKCPSCGNKRDFVLVDQKLYDARWIVIEEPFELVEAERPSTLMVYLKEDLTSVKLRNKTDPGNRIRITGILKQIQRRLRGRKSKQLEIYLEANHIEPLETEWEELEITKEDEQKILELAKDPNIYEKLVKSIAPGIYGLEHVKEAIALQLFSGVPKVLPDGSRIRGDIHLLLIGDPSTAKSQLLKTVSKLMPRARYVSGKGVSGVGLTAAVTRDEEFFGGWVLEAGALVLCNKSVLCIDEFEKVEKNDQIALHEAMEQQSYGKNVKILLVDGREVEIGRLVDELIEKHKEKVIKGKDCEILELKGIEDIYLLTTDFKKIYKTKAAQVSRHKAPKKLLKIKFSNGREIIVTPEHPFWILKDLEWKTLPASALKIGDYIPAPLHLPIKGKDVLSKDWCRFLGYLITDGGYEVNRGVKNGINFTNTNPQLLNDFYNLSQKLFKVKPYIYSKEKRTPMVRIISKPVLKSISNLGKSLIEKSENKFIPQTLMITSLENLREFLKAAFECDGYVTLNRIGIVSPNKTFCEQIHSILLRFGITSQIFEEKLKSGKNFYRLTITGIENLKRFRKEIGFLSLRKNKRLEKECEKKNYRTIKDIIPNVGKEVSRIAKELKIKESLVLGYSIKHFKEKGNFSRRALQKFVKTFEERIKRIKKTLEKVEKVNEIEKLKLLRKEISVSQADLAKELKVCRQTISYWERFNKNAKNYKKAFITILKKMMKNEVKIKKLKQLAFGKIGWVKIVKIEEFEYKHPWVYDIGVKPTQTFISEGLILHNSISIAKANIVATLPAQTAILAGGNPKLGRFDPYIPIKEQVDIPETLLARFDLKFALRDKPDPERDSLIADYILRTRHFEEAAAKPEIEPELLRKYIAYARKNCRPKLSKEAGEKLKEFFVNLRAKASEEEAPIPITLRQYEALIRLAEASARIQLRDEVNVEDAERAIRLMKISLREFGFDPETGQFDIDRAEGQKVTAAQRSKIRKMLDIIDELTALQGAEVDRGEILRRAKEEGIDNAEEILNKMLREGLVFSPRANKISKL